MATWRYSINPGDSVETIVQAAGAAIVTKNIELTVDMGSDLSGATQRISKNDVLIALEQLKEVIVKGNWYPA